MLAAFRSCSTIAAWMHSRQGQVLTADPKREMEPHEVESISTLVDGRDPTPLLTRRMRALNLDPADVVRSEPAMFYEFRGLCRGCEAREACAWTLEHGGEDPAWQEWRNYCPNSAKLRMLSALRSCCFPADA